MLKNSSKIPRSGFRCGWLPEFNQVFLSTDTHISGIIFLREVANKQTDRKMERKTDRQTDKRRIKHNLIGGGNDDWKLCNLYTRLWKHIPGSFVALHTKMFAQAVAHSDQSCW